MTEEGYDGSGLSVCFGWDQRGGREGQDRGRRARIALALHFPLRKNRQFMISCRLRRVQC